MLTVSVFIVPFLQNDGDRDKGETMMERLLVACRDSQPILEKYNLVEKFAIGK